MPFFFFAILVGILLLGVGIACWRMLAQSRDVWLWLPRSRRPGAVLTCGAVVWCALQLLPLIGGESQGATRFLLAIALGIGLAACSYYWLDYLFARSLGGMMVLTVESLLHAAFVGHAVFHPFFSALGYVYGVAGIYFIAAPYRFRDLLEQMEKNAGWRRALSVFFMASGGFAILVALVTGHG